MSTDSSVVESALPKLPQLANELETYFIIARQIESELFSEKIQKRQLQQEVSDFGRRLKDTTLREDLLRQQVKQLQLNEKNLSDQLKDSCLQIDHFYDEKKKIKNQIEALQSQLVIAQKNEESLKTMLSSLQENEKNRAQQDAHTIKELQFLRNELYRYRSAWKKISMIDQKAKETLQQSDQLSQKVEELRVGIQNERNRNAFLEEQIHKERREKNIALSCLQKAEAKLAEMPKIVEHKPVTGTNSSFVAEEGLSLGF